MAAPLNNRNAAKSRDWTDTLRWVLENYEGSGIAKGQALRAVGRTVVEKAIAGDLGAILEIGNRLDGKPHQALALTGEDGGAILQRIERVIVRAETEPTDR